MASRHQRGRWALRPSTSVAPTDRVLNQLLNAPDVAIWSVDRAHRFV